MIGKLHLPLLSGELVTGWALIGFLAAALVLILLNGAYVAYEFAVLTAKRQEFEEANPSRATRAALGSLSDLSMQLTGAQLGITMVSLGLGYVAEPAFESIIGPIVDGFLSPEATTAVGVVGALSIVIFLHLVVGEMVPKNMALAHPGPTLRWLVLPYKAYLWLFRPLAVLLNAIANFGCRIVGVEPRNELIAIHSVAELLDIVTLSSAEGAIESDSAELLHGALSFSQRPIVDIAVPIADLASVRFGATPALLERVVAGSGQVRIPVMGPRQLVGYFNVRDLLKIDPRERMKPMPESLLRSVIKVQSTRSLVEVLRTLRSRRRPFAMVMSADDELVGVVSVEEIVEALLPGDSKTADALAVGPVVEIDDQT